MEKLSHGSSASSSVLNATQQDTSNDPGTVAITRWLMYSCPRKSLSPLRNTPGENPKEYF